MQKKNDKINLTRPCDVAYTLVCKLDFVMVSKGPIKSKTYQDAALEERRNLCKLGLLFG